MEIQVTQKDIDRGVRYAPLHCPIAQAVTRRTGYHAAVDAHYVTLHDEDGDIAGRWVTPPEVLAWLSTFDNGESVRPATFQLVMPAKYPRIA